MEGGWASCPPRKPCTSRVHLRPDMGGLAASPGRPPPLGMGQDVPAPLSTPRHNVGPLAAPSTLSCVSSSGGNCTTLKTHLPLLNSVRLEDT